MQQPIKLHERCELKTMVGSVTMVCSIVWSNLQINFYVEIIVREIIPVKSQNALIVTQNEIIVKQLSNVSKLAS